MVQSGVGLLQNVMKISLFAGNQYFPALKNREEAQNQNGNQADGKA